MPCAPLLAAVLAALPAASQQNIRATVEAPVSMPAWTGQAANAAPLGALNLQTALSLPYGGPASVLVPGPMALPAPDLQILPAAPTPLAQSLAGLENAVGAARKADEGDSSGAAAGGELGQVFGEGAPRPQGAVPAAGLSGADVSFEGVRLLGRAAVYFQEVKRLVDKYKGTVDLGESLDVMDDSYGDVWSKLRAIEALARDRGVSQANTHLKGTLLWVDGVLEERGHRVAIHTNRTFFHHAKNPQSEINEGLRRLDGYIREVTANLAVDGKAERAMGAFDEVVLVFDTRGYDEIKRQLKAKENEVRHRHGSRFRFVYLDELVKMPESDAQTRRELNELTRKYQSDAEGLRNIIEGVIYSRYVGLLLELKSLEYYVDRGYKVLQSGRDLFDDAGMYVTELDIVLQSPQGEIVIIEAKSARVGIPKKEALRSKVLYKLETYRRNRELMERRLGGPFKVVFAFDVGRNLGLRPFLERQAGELSRKYGIPTEFLFLKSVPLEEDQEAAEEPAPAREAAPAYLQRKQAPVSEREVESLEARRGDQVLNALRPMRYPTSIVVNLAKAARRHDPFTLNIHRAARSQRFASVVMTPEWADRLPGLAEYERSVIERLTEGGQAVESLLPETNRKTPDLLVNGTPTELKGVTKETDVLKLLDKANEQVGAFDHRYRTGPGEAILDILPDRDGLAPAPEWVLGQVRHWARQARDLALRRVWVMQGGEAWPVELKPSPSRPEPPSPDVQTPDGRDLPWKETLREIGDKLRR